MRLQIDNQDLPDWLQYVLIGGVVCLVILILCVLERVKCILKCIYCLVCCRCCASKNTERKQNNQLAYERI